jgi:hypothetical protein
LKSSEGSSEYIKRFFTSIARDAVYQLLCSNSIGFGLTHLIGRKGEVEYLSLFKLEQEADARTAALTEKFLHEIPLLSDVPIASVLKLRNQKRDAFITYRDTLNKLISEHLERGGGLSHEDASNLYADVLAPRISRLRIEANNFRKSQRIRASVKLLTSGALVGLGVVGGVLPSQLADLIRVIGGISVFKDIVECASESLSSPASVQTNDLYFLLRLQSAH